MNIRRIINKHLRREDEGVQVAGDVNAVISANIGEPAGSVTRTSSRRHSRIVQRSGGTATSETRQSHDQREGSE